MLVNFWFMSHNFRSRYARKSTKGSVDADFDLVFNETLSPKMFIQTLFFSRRFVYMPVIGDDKLR